jgi:hypothetical protein
MFFPPVYFEALRRRRTVGLEFDKLLQNFSEPRSKQPAKPQPLAKFRLGENELPLSAFDSINPDVSICARPLAIEECNHVASVGSITLPVLIRTHVE